MYHSYIRSIEITNSQNQQVIKTRDVLFKVQQTIHDDYKLLEKSYKNKKYSAMIITQFLRTTLKYQKKKKSLDLEKVATDE